MSFLSVGLPGHGASHARSVGVSPLWHRRWLSLAAVLLGAGAAHAEQPNLADVVVTASLRPTTVLDVPGSVTVLGSDELRSTGQQHIEDVIATVPNLNWAADTARARYFQIRGIGELAQYQGAPNPSIGFLIDDIDFSGLGTVATLFDVDNVQVLRGPQGARYGANALGGLIYVTSAAPTPDYEGRVELGAGDYNSRSYGVVINGPAAPLDSAFRIAAQRFTSDGYYSNAFLQRNDTARFDEVTLRGRWRSQPTDRLRIDISLMHTQVDDGYDNFSINNTRTTLSDQPGEDSQHSTGVAAHVDYRLSASLQLTTIATFADSPIRYSYDGDWGNLAEWAPYVYQSSEVQNRRRTTRNLEVRLAGDPGPGTSWTAGLYTLALRETLDDTIYNLYQDPTSGYLPAPSVQTTTSVFESRATSAFAAIDQDLTDAVRASAGIRAERRTVSYHDALSATGAAPVARAFAPADTLWGGNLALRWKAAPTTSVYGLISRGYRDGGFNLSAGLPTNELQFGPESDLNFEIGIKNDVPATKLHFDAAVFYTQRHELQLLTGTQLQPDDPSTFVFYTGNAPSGFTRGAEFTVGWQLAPQLELGGSLGLLDTRYHGFAQNHVVLPDRELPNAPWWQAAVHLAWTHPRGPFARLDLTGMGGSYYDLPPNPTASRAFGLVNLRGGVETRRWTVALWARNVLNKDYATRGFYFGDEPPNFPNKLYLQLGAPRTLGINLTARY
jgi:iron complex outermembrane receptor protein